MEDYEYSYPEEEEKKPRKRLNLSIIIALFVGLSVGAVAGYAIGSESPEILGSPAIAFSPLSILIFNAVVVIVVLLLLLTKGARIQRSAPQMRGSTVWMKFMILVMIALLLAGFFGFYVMLNFAQ